ncbi:arylsulfatase J-like [Amphibalanus amphitrite]|uniref:arylsulfatase J-like n=1 Tax=Amphibalanus amphitrite TaxID=1232801 RepID=UPI001C928A6E|nr:arylsulfatase J-like [Amphibalanus amphitrite]
MASLRVVALFLVLIGVAVSAPASESTPPNIVFIVADDVGFNDISWHNSDILTPNLAKLAGEGVLLERSYVQPVCSPSRSAALTGLYPYHMGTQRSAYLPCQPTGLSVNFTLLPERLRSVGYSTHAVGKWHLGHCAPEFLPHNRGFDSFYGVWNGREDHFTHTLNGSLDLRSNDEPDWDQSGVYSTELFASRAERIISEHNKSKPLFLYLPFLAAHQPVQSPEELEELYPNIPNDLRRTFSGMVTAIDLAVGRVVESLKASGLYENSVIAFISDNGGNVTAAGNNWPLRGFKSTLWEGGTRTPAFVVSPLLQKTGYVSSELIHVTDWAPTFLRLAGVDTSDLNFDGVDQWETLSTGSLSARDEFVYNIDQRDDGDFSAALRQGDMKLIWGSPGRYNDWYPVPDSNGDAVQDLSDAVNIDNEDEVDVMDVSASRHGDPQPVYLFNVTADPDERVDLAEQMPDVVKRMQDRVLELMEDLVPADYPKQIIDGYPTKGLWETGWCDAH